MGRNALTEVISANMLTSGFTDDTTIHTSGARNTTARKMLSVYISIRLSSLLFNSHSRSSSQSRSIKRRLSAMDTNTTIRKKTTAMADA